MHFGELALILAGGTATGLGTIFLARHSFRPSVQPATANLLACSVVLAWTVILGTLAALKHLSFHSGAYDLGIFDQVIWNSANGRLFENSIVAEAPFFLGHHFELILLLLVPFYWIYASPVTLVGVQALFLALSGIPLYLLARDFLRSPALALVLLVAYLLQPATAYVALFDFHEVAIAAPLLSLALYFVLRQRYGLFGFALGLAFLAKEDIGLIGAALGVFIILRQRNWRIGIPVMVAGILWTVLLVRFVIPSLNPSGAYSFKTLYTDLGATPQAVLTNLLHDPSRFLRPMLNSEKLIYLQQLLAPLGGLSLLGWPVLAIAIPSFLSILLSDSFPRFLIRHHYSAVLLAPLLAATIVGVRWLLDRAGSSWPSLRPGIGGFVVGVTFVGAYLYGPLPLARNFEPQNYQQTPRLAVARHLIAQIPAEASIIAQSGLVPQLSQRRTIEVFARSDPTLRPDFYFLDTDSNALRYPLPQGEDYPYLRALRRVSADAEYRLIVERDGYLLFRRETPDLGSLLEVTFGDQITLVACEADSQQAMAGSTLRLTLYWRAEGKMAANYSLFTHLVGPEGKVWGQLDGYPTGEYLATSEWEPGRLWRADWSIPIDRRAPPGEYRVLAGLYDLTTMKRLPVSHGAAEQGGSSIVVETATISAVPG